MFAIIGATGRTGRQAAETLRSWGLPVRAVVRSPEKAVDLAARGVEVVVADLDDEASLTAALAGATSLYFLTTPTWTAANPVGEAAERGERVVRAAKAAGIGHVVFLSSVGAQHPAGTGPIASLYIVEEALRASGIPSTFLRAAYFAQNWEQVAAPAASDGVLHSFIAADTLVPMVDVRDIGRTAAELLAEGPNGVRVVELAGPADVSPTHVAASFAELTGRPVQVAAYPAEAAAGALTQQGLPAPIAAAYGEMYQGIAHGLVAFEGPPRRGRVPLADSVRSLLPR
ncbi:MAG: NmrA family NAD(P)-binding protein [Alphaproteobacteria bacterium]|nr:NmrA family NAD(P)-binding protein [Alphaproteobacteria bacterium]